MGKVKTFYHEEIIRRSRENTDDLDDEYFYEQYRKQQLWEQHPDFKKQLKKIKQNDKRKTNRRGN